MFTTDSLLISNSYGEVQRALVNVGSTILQTLFKDALNLKTGMAGVETAQAT
jgi:hypothetical protein